MKGQRMIAVAHRVIKTRVAFNDAVASNDPNRINTAYRQLTETKQLAARLIRG